MITAFAIFILVHGFIHLLGFAKAFRLAEVRELDMPVTPLFGILWLAAFLLHGITAVLILLSFNIWWITGFLGVILSTFLIFNSWQYAKFGTLPNLLILLVAFLGWADYRFNKDFTHYAREIINSSQLQQTEIVTDSMLSHLPVQMQDYLRKVGIVGRPFIYNVRIRQDCNIKMTPEQKEFSPANALQYVSVNQSSFVWKVRMNMYPFIDITGKDMLIRGKGSMSIKILSLLPVVDAKGKQMDEGALQRLMCEAIWYPSAFLRPAFSWETTDNQTVVFTYQLNDLQAKATIHFGEDGLIRRMSAQRFQGGGEDAVRREWIVDIEKYDTFHQIKVPSRIAVTWKGETTEWKWLEMDIKEIDYNIGQI